MMNRYQLLATALSIFVCASPIAAQGTIAQRVARAPDGIVRLQFASRSGTCGDGEDLIGYRKALFAANFQSFGDWSGARCVPGPLRVALTVAGGRVTQLRTSVGGDWSRSASRVTDLGTVAPTEAATFFFGLVPQLEQVSNKARFLLPAVLADAPETVGRLIDLARDDARSQETRRQAIQWLGLLGDASVIPVLVSFAREGGDAPPGNDIDHDGRKPGKVGRRDKADKKSLSSAATAALSLLENGVGIPALIDLARSGGSAVRHSSVFWLGQSGDARAISTLHAVIENASEEARIRAHAIFALAHGDKNPEREFEYLRSIFPRLQSDRLKESVLQGIGQDESGGGAWLLQKARDRGESMKIRKSAVFWAGQSEGTRTGDIVAFYRSINEPQLREHAIFVLSQRDDREATDELLRIARGDSDRNMRARALFWLGQKDDPRVANLIEERLSR